MPVVQCFPVKVRKMMAAFGNFLKIVFLSPSEPRLRAGWRLLLQTLLFLIAIVCAGVPFALLRESPSASGLMRLLSEVANLLAVTFSVLVARRYLDRRSFVSLGLRLDRQALLDILIGILITLVMMGLISLTMQALGWARVEGFAWQTERAGHSPLAGFRQVAGNTLLYFLVFVMVGWEEELLSRGYHLQTIASGTNLLWGTVISSVIFGVLHLGNPHATWAAVLGIFCAGLFLACGYLWSGQLWLPIGLHIGWNFFEGVVFGFPVSGLETYRLMQMAVSGPELWTGGAFGPEAGLIILPAMAVGTLLLYLYTRRRRKPTALVS
jgi:membrane protease YdiL (CAAX protease family)